VEGAPVEGEGEAVGGGGAAVGLRKSPGPITLTAFGLHLLNTLVLFSRGTRFFPTHLEIPFTSL
jgi:hypothetical protein